MEKQALISLISNAITQKAEKEVEHQTQTTDFSFLLTLKEGGIYSFNVDKKVGGNAAFLNKRDEVILRSKSWHDFDTLLLQEVANKLA